MKSEFDREIDWLLRGHGERARRGEAAADRDAADAMSERGNRRDSSPDARLSAHLDADELSAYAENALPPATRSLYTAHLADCADCRCIVTSIALAANVAGELEKQRPSDETAPSSSWLAWLSALFSPRVMRYAAPALAVLVLAVVAFVALRQESRESEMAGLKEQSAPASVTKTVDESQAEQTSTTATTAGAVNTASMMNANTNTTNANVPNTQSTLPQPKTSADAVGSSSGVNTAAPVAPAPQAAPPTLNDRAAQNYTGIPLEERPAEPEAHAARTEAKQEAREVAKDEPAGRDEVARVASNRSDEESAKKKEEFQVQRRSGVAAERTAAAGGAGGQQQNADMVRVQPMQAPSASEADALRRRTLSSKRAPSRVARETEEIEPVVETRSVAGRRFRRQGGVWIDTAYTSKQATTVVRRGTEQFRALVADEPQLRSIADQLGGELVVIWKGRAYRIK